MSSNTSKNMNIIVKILRSLEESSLSDELTYYLREVQRDNDLSDEAMENFFSFKKMGDAIENVRDHTQVHRTYKGKTVYSGNTEEKATIDTALISPREPDTHFYDVGKSTPTWELLDDDEKKSELDSDMDEYWKGDETQIPPKNRDPFAKMLRAKFRSLGLDKKVVKSFLRNPP